MLAVPAEAILRLGRESKHAPRRQEPVAPISSP
jgi:hypothetical protein